MTDLQFPCCIIDALESRGLHELQRMSQAASRSEIKLCAKARALSSTSAASMSSPASVSSSHTKTLCPEHTHTLPTHMALTTLTILGQFLQPLRHHNHLISWLKARPYSPHTASFSSLAIQSGIPSNLHPLLLCPPCVVFSRRSQWDSFSSPPNPSPISCHTNLPQTQTSFLKYIFFYLF